MESRVADGRENGPRRGQSEACWQRCSAPALLRSCCFSLCLRPCRPCDAFAWGEREAASPDVYRSAAGEGPIHHLSCEAKIKIKIKQAQGVKMSRVTTTGQVRRRLTRWRTLLKPTTPLFAFFWGQVSVHDPC